MTIAVKVVVAQFIGLDPSFDPLVSVGVVS